MLSPFRGVLKLNGSWYEPAIGGQGVQFVAQPGGVLIAPGLPSILKVAADDSARQHWSRCRAASRMSEATLPPYAVGAATITVTACDRITVAYQFNGNAPAGPAYQTRSGTLDLIEAGGCSP